MLVRRFSPLFVTLKQKKHRNDAFLCYKVYRINSNCHQNLDYHNRWGLNHLQTH